MKASELFHMLNQMWEADPLDLENWRVVTKDGRPVTGVHFSHDTKKVTMAVSYTHLTLPTID
jgi:hypothetical protein